jgi:hypothetical protein
MIPPIEAQKTNAKAMHPLDHRVGTAQIAVDRRSCDLSDGRVEQVHRGGGDGGRERKPAETRGPVMEVVAEAL